MALRVEVGHVRATTSWRRFAIESVGAVISTTRHQQQTRSAGASCSAPVLTPDKCVDEAIFINTSGGWLKGCQALADLLTPLHASGGSFHEHTRRHVVEELRFIRPYAAIAVVKTLDIRRAGVATAGEETRGLVVVSTEGGHWKMTANQNARIQATPVGDR